MEKKRDIIIILFLFLGGGHVLLGGGGGGIHKILHQVQGLGYQQQSIGALYLK